MLKYLIIIKLLLYSLFVQGQIKDTDRILLEYQNYKSDYLSKSKRFFIRLYKNDFSCDIKKYHLKRMDLDYYPIPVYKIQIKSKDKIDKINFEQIFEYIKIDRRAKPMTLVKKNKNYFGELISTANSKGSPWLVNSAIICNEESDTKYFEESIEMMKFLEEFKPDLIGFINNTSLGYFLIKESQVYFLGYYNTKEKPQKYKAVLPKEWLKDLEERRKTSWVDLLWLK